MAVLIHERGFLTCLIIDKIDGEWRGAGQIKRYELLPGERTLQVRINPALQHAKDRLIRFDARAGETYRFEGDVSFSKSGWTAWVREVSTGRKFFAEPLKQ